jgi:hypothetical protein
VATFTVPIGSDGNAHNFDLLLVRADAPWA